MSLFGNGKFGSGLIGMGLFGSEDDDETNLSKVKLPDFKEDPDYRKLQDFLSTLGIDILGGKIPDYYKGIGETGSPEFEKNLNLVNADITRSMTDAAALTGGRGGNVAESIGREVARNTTTSRYADYLRAMGGKQYLFGAGTGISENSRTAAQNQQAQVNSFALNRTGLDLKKAGMMDEQDLLKGQMEGQSASAMFDLALKGALGFAVGGPMGAATAMTGMGGVGDIMDIFGKGKPGSSLPGTSQAPVIKNLGRINSSDLDLDKLFADTFRP